MSGIPGKPAAPIGGPSTSLESKQSVVPSTTLEEKPCRCGCWFCARCCRSLGLGVRERLIPIVESFTGLMMLTLTIDPQLFESPEAAYLHARERRAIGRLMRDLKRGGHLHSPRYFAVVEWQKDTEMVHFHVLIDATKVPKTAIDKAWSKNRPTYAGLKAPNRPAFGMTRFSKRRFQGGAEHAARYATKYLLKVPPHGWPRWVLEAGRDFRIPRYQPSKGLWGGGAKTAKPARVFDRPSIRERPGRTYTERIAECGTAVNVFARVSGVSPDSGQPISRRYWLKRKPIDPAAAPEPTPTATGSPSDYGAPPEAVA